MDDIGSALPVVKPRKRGLFVKGDPRAGRPRGVANRATSNAREAIARLVDENAPKMMQWLEQIAEKDPVAAWRCMADVIEYHIPKLSRQEVTGADGKDLGPQVVNIIFTKAPDSDNRT